MNSELLATLDYIEQERGISREVLIDTIEKAILSASKKSIHPANDVEVKIDRASGLIKAWAKLEVVDGSPTCDQILIAVAKERYPNAKLGDIVKWEVTPKNFGRIAAQYAKNTIMNQLRKAEKEIVLDEFKDRVGQIVSGVVRRFEAGNIIVDMQKAEGVLTPKEKIPGESYMQGDRINALLKKIDPSGAGPSLILSRVSDELIRRLFEREVSEIHDGIVQIKGIAREAGSRTKIAVFSSDAHVDPIGACVGMRGMRVKNITAELGGEKIDIIR
ncbi:MAG: transcription termination factor NusA, partial [Victivallales bacterium]